MSSIERGGVAKFFFVVAATLRASSTDIDFGAGAGCCFLLWATTSDAVAQKAKPATPKTARRQSKRMTTPPWTARAALKTACIWTPFYDFLSQAPDASKVPLGGTSLERNCGSHPQRCA